MKIREADNNLTPLEKIENRILLVRGQKVMLDRDLALLYGVQTKVLNQSVKRNKERFPEDFMFQLTKMEAEYLLQERDDSSRSQIVTLNEDDILNKNGENKAKNLKSQFVTSSLEASRSQTVILDKDNRRGENIKFMPYVFTEQGVAMLSSVLKSPKAIEMNIVIMRAFVKIRNLIYSYKDLSEKIEKMEKKYDKQIGQIFSIMKSLHDDSETRQEIGFVEK